MRHDLSRMKQFGKAVRQRRINEGGKQKAAAQKIGISNTHLCNIERGNYIDRGHIETSVKTRKKIAKFFGLRAA